jgi:hypothetical protein
VRYDGNTEAVFSADQPLGQEFNLWALDRAVPYRDVPFMLLDASRVAERSCATSGTNNYLAVRIFDRPSGKRGPSRRGGQDDQWQCDNQHFHEFGALPGLSAPILRLHVAEHCQSLVDLRRGTETAACTYLFSALGFEIEKRFS